MKQPPRGQLNSPVVKRMMKHVGRGHVWIYRRSGGRVGGTLRMGAALRKPAPVLLLDHTGRRSGRALTTPLLYLRDGDDVVVVASSGGMDAMPQWYLNLRAQPDTTVQVGRDVWPVRARTATPEEKQALWPRLVDVYADFASYQQWTDREIPVVICEPRSDA